MRLAVLLSLLLLGACTIREDTFAARDNSEPEMDGGLSLAAPAVSDNPRLDEDTTGCRGAYARGSSRLQDMRDSVWDPFCD